MSTDTSVRSGPAVTDPSRDPSHYWPTRHAVVRHKERGVPWSRVADALEHGETRGRDRDDLLAFVESHPPEDERPVWVVARPANGEILTVAWGEPERDDR